MSKIVYKSKEGTPVPQFGLLVGYQSCDVIRDRAGRGKDWLLRMTDMCGELNVPQSVVQTKVCTTCTTIVVHVWYKNKAPPMDLKRFNMTSK